MPEAAVHKDGGAPARKDYVRAKTFGKEDIDSETKSAPMQRSPQLALGPRSELWPPFEVPAVLGRDPSRLVRPRQTCVAW